MNRKERYQYIITYFKKHSPTATTELDFDSAFQLICAVLLSAQCTDKRVNIVTPALFKHYPTIESLAKADIAEVYEYIKSISYPNAKAKHLVEMAKMLKEKFKGIIPNTTEELMLLPGVGRKTANVVQAVWFGKARMAVDTHVYRVSHRLGLVSKSANTPLKVEKELVINIQEEDIVNAHHWLILHGRYICLSRIPKCIKCPFDNFCPKLLEGSKLE